MDPPPGASPRRGYGIRRPGAEESGAICPKIGRHWPRGRSRVIHPISGESEKLGRKFRRQLLWKRTRRSAEFPFAAGGRLEESSGRGRRPELGYQADVSGADFSHISGRLAGSTIGKSESPDSGAWGETNGGDLQPCGAALLAASCPFFWGDSDAQGYWKLGIPAGEPGRRLRRATFSQIGRFSVCLRNCDPPGNFPEIRKSGHRRFR